MTEPEMQIFARALVADINRTTLALPAFIILSAHGHSWAAKWLGVQ